MKHFALFAALTLLAAAPVVHGAVVLGGILSPAPGASLFEADNGSGNIYAFTPAGVQSTFASLLSGPGGPVGLAFDAAGNLYVGDSNSGNIIKISPSGVQSTFASSTGFFSTSTAALAFDAAGNLYWAVVALNEILKFTPAGVQSTFASGLQAPFGLAFDAAGNLYVSELQLPGYDVLKFPAGGGAPSTFASGLNQPAGLALDAAGNLYEADAGSGKINKFSPTGTLLGAFASGLPSPEALAFDAAGNLYETAFGGSTILKFTPAGLKSTFASGLNIPLFLAFGPAPNDDFQIRYFSNVTTLGGSLINLSNTGANAGATGALGFSNGNICANIYVFDPNEEELACCSCAITPNALQSISVQGLLSNLLTVENPDATVVKLLATGVNGGTCDPTTAGSAANPLVPGLRAWATTLHKSGGTPGFTYGTETEFSQAGLTLSQGELNRLTNTCAFIVANGSNNGKCKACVSAGGQ